MELLKFVEIAYHRHSILAAAVSHVMSMTSYTPPPPPPTPRRKFFKLSFLHEYYTKIFQTLKNFFYTRLCIKNNKIRQKN